MSREVTARPSAEVDRKAAGGDRRRRWWIWLIAAALTVLPAGAWLARESMVAQSWVRVERRDLVIGVELEGELTAVDSADIGPPQIPQVWNFKISMMAPEGAEVEKGSPVLGFDTTELQQKLLEKIAERDSAEKKLEKRATDLDIEQRSKELQLAEAEAELRKSDLKLSVPEEVVKRHELEEARIDHRLASLKIDFARTSLEHLAAQRQADLETLRKQRDRAATRVEEIRTHIDQMTVRAPRAGTVIYKTNWRGDKSKIGDSAWRTLTVLQIPDLSRMRAEGKVAEADAGRLEAGQPVIFRLDAYPDQEYRGTVESIRRTVQRKSRSNPEKVVRLEIAVEHTDTERMRPGMRLRGTVETGRIVDTLVVPGDAVFQSPAGIAVYRRTLLGRDQVFPQFGQRGADGFEVTAGLAEGDRLLRRGSGEDS